MKIKTYPLQFTEEYLKHIEEVAKEQGKTIKDFILEAIKEKIEKLVDTCFQSRVIYRIKDRY